MKKVLFVFALLVGFAFQPAFAKTTPVQTLQDFSIQNPSKTLLIKILSNVQLGDGVCVETSSCRRHCSPCSPPSLKEVTLI